MTLFHDYKLIIIIKTIVILFSVFGLDHKQTYLEARMH